MKGIIWAYDIDDAIVQLAEIEAQYTLLKIDVVNKTISKFNNSYITFANGDIWRVLKASDSGKGYVANVSYIDRRISADIINTIIKPATCSWPYQAFHFYYPASIKWPREDEVFETKLI